jgi:predicted O-methyltransferase YrrM
LTASLAETLERIEALFPFPDARRLKTVARYELAQQATGGCIVELGTATGAGAIALAMGANVPVYTIDDYAKRQGWANEWYGPQNAEVCEQNIESAGVAVNLYCSEIREAAQFWTEPVALLFWDLGVRKSMIEDVRLWEPHIISGGVLAVVDLYDGSLGITHLQDALREAGTFEEAEPMGGGVWRFVKR